MSPHPMKHKPKTQASFFDALVKSRAFKALNPEQKLDAMLAYKDFNQLLKDGDLFDVQGVARRTGYTPQHVRVLCRQEKLACIKRGYGASSPQADEEFQYFFLREQASSLFAAQKGKA
jgi:hypothetical protein